MSSHSTITDVVTGAFGYSGKYIANRLLAMDHSVRTLTNSPDRGGALQGKVYSHPLNFDNHVALTRSLEGVTTFYNTYWVRFDHDDFSHSKAVANTLKLFAAAKEVGVKRFVHVSITNPSLDSHLPYFKGKAQLEEALKNTGMSYAILRPTVLFGREDILVNNIAWALRKFPAFFVFGDGRYKLQPIYVDDLAALAVREGQNTANVIIDAIGPETFTFRELVLAIRSCLKLRTPLVSVSPKVGYVASRMIDLFTSDMMVTKEEIDGLMSNLLLTNSPPAGPTKLTEWIVENKSILGTSYANELARRRDRVSAY